MAAWATGAWATGALRAFSWVGDAIEYATGALTGAARAISTFWRTMTR